MNKMKNKKTVLLASLLLGILLTACGKHVKTATTYYSLVSRSANYSFIRLEADGNFYNNRGLTGTYEINDGKIKFFENNGGTTEGFLDGDYLFYFVYDKGKDKIPDSESFSIKVSDTHSNFTFTEDGSFTEIVKYADPTSAGAWKGTYKREGNILRLSMVMKGGEQVERVYGIKDGMMYNAYSCDESLFDADSIATVEEAERKAAEKETGILGVLLIVIIMLVVLAAVIFIIVYSQKKKQKDFDKSEK